MAFAVSTVGGVGCLLPGPWFGGGNFVGSVYLFTLQHGGGLSLAPSWAEVRAQLATISIFLTARTLGHSLHACGLCKMIPAGLAGPGVASPGSPSLLSPSEWISDYTDSVLDPEALRVEVDTFMEAYDKKIAEVGLARRWHVTRAAMGQGGVAGVAVWLLWGGAVTACPDHRVESRLT